MKKNINVLVYPSGGENGLDVHTALKDVVNIRVFGASSVDNHSKFVYKNFIENAPSILEKDFIPGFNQLIEAYKIDVIIPCHDSVVEFLAKNKDKISAIIAASNYDTTKICRYKRLTYKAIKNSKFCPTIYTSIEEADFPVFIKPNKGEGSRNTVLINSIEEYKKVESVKKIDYVLSEYLPGNEFTVDCFTDRYGNLRFVGSRSRSRVFGGISVRSETVDNKRFLPIAEDINNAMTFRGLWYFQVKEDLQGNLKIMEVSARVAGTMNVYRQRGVNLPLLTVYDALDYDVAILDNGFSVIMDRSLQPKYFVDISYNQVYLDFDDTLLMHYGVNTLVMSFVYQCVQKQVQVHLITKHEKNLTESMRQYHIPKELFSSITHIKQEENKVGYITAKDAIFIDNAYLERKAVFDKLGIPVFDVDAVQCLVDWRR